MDYPRCVDQMVRLATAIAANNKEAALRDGLFGFDGALSGTRTHGLSLRRAALYPLSYQRTTMVPKVGLEPTRA